jgi:hypothetical protein
MGTLKLQNFDNPHRKNFLFTSPKGIPWAQIKIARSKLIPIIIWMAGLATRTELGFK